MTEYPNRVVVSMTRAELDLVRRLITDRTVDELVPLNKAENLVLVYWRRERPPLIGPAQKPRPKLSYGYVPRRKRLAR